MKMLTIEYKDLLGDYEPDGLMWGYVNRQIHTFNNETPLLHICVSSHILINMFRIMIKRKVLICDQVQFKFKEQIITVNQQGGLSCWPEGFCDIDEIVLLELCG